ncbi:MAG: copper resistance protein NlpE N-terminal domain-containing protein [Elusimicrobiota bacterium]|jgi:copper homeostasis protein (lipoprotein)|nr:copper resistance protein NlpE N-terminal domain-containing protein [Elusimicrobiota bacterium]
MKHLFAFFIFSLFLFGCSVPSTPKNTQDLLKNYTGTFAGLLPCADCSGLDSELHLNSDYTFKLTETYLEKGGPFITTGVWSPIKDFKAVKLVSDETPPATSFYGFINKDTILWLDSNAEVIESNFNYKLNRI